MRRRLICARRQDQGRALSQRRGARFAGGIQALLESALWFAGRYAGTKTLQPAREHSRRLARRDSPRAGEGRAYESPFGE